MNPRKLIFPLIIIVVAIATSVITIHLQHDHQQKSETEIKQSPKDFMNYIFGELQLDSNQVELFTEITGEFHRNGKMLDTELQNKKIELLKELSKYESDSLFMMNLVKEIGDLEYQLSLLTLNHYFSSKAILEPSQLFSLKKIYREMLPDGIK